jgi:ketosteroid isomerase-like protein
MRSLKCVAAALLITAFSTSSFAGQSQESADANELRRLEQVWNDAYRNGDAQPLEELLSDDLIVTMADMVLMDKKQSVALLRSGRFKFPRYETSEIRVRIYNDSAVVTGRLQRTRSINGNSVDDDWRFTKVYARQSGKWQVVAWHASTNARR